MLPAALGAVATIILSGLIAWLVARATIDRRRQDFLEGERRRVFGTMLHAVSEVLHSDEPKQAWRLFREAKAQFLLFAGPAARRALAEWQGALDEYTEAEARVGKQAMESSDFDPDPWMLVTDLAEVFRFELGDTVTVRDNALVSDRNVRILPGPEET